MEVTVTSLSASDVVKEGSSGPCAPYAREKLTGWLLKRKGDGARTRIMGGINRRFFTLDFQSQVFYYAHSESGGKSVSVPVPFCKIMGVEPLQAAVLADGAAEEAETSGAPMDRTPSKNSKTSHFRMPKMPGFAQKRSVEHHGLAVLTGERRWELLCSSQAEAEVWLEGFREAAVVGGRLPASQADKAEISTASGSSNRTTPPSSRSPSPVDSDAPNNEENNDLVDEVFAPMEPPANAVATEQMAPPTEFAAPEKEEADERSSSKGSLFRLLPTRQPKLDRSGPLSDGAEVTAMGSSGNGAMLGDQAWGLAQSGASEVRVEVAAQSAACRYDDKGRGLSLEQRLSQMNFSDSEDDDAEVVKAASQTTPKARRSWRRGGRQEAPSAPGPASPGPDSVEACQSFVQEDSDTDEE